MGLFYEAPPSRLSIEVGLDRCHDLAARIGAALPPGGGGSVRPLAASAGVSGGGEGGPGGNDGARVPSGPLVHPTPSTGWTRPAILLGEALTPDPAQDPRVCERCGREADRSSSTLARLVFRYECDTCSRWWVA